MVVARHYKSQESSEEEPVELQLQQLPSQQHVLRTHELVTAPVTLPRLTHSVLLLSLSR